VITVKILLWHYPCCTEENYKRILGMINPWLGFRLGATELDAGLLFKSFGLSCQPFFIGHVSPYDGTSPY